MIRQEIIKRLREIPVEELNRDKSGFRVGLLKEHGYLTLADVWVSSTAKLSRINGIGGDSAQKITEKANEYADRVKATVKISVSEDNRTDEKSAVIKSIFEYYLYQSFLKNHRDRLCSCTEQAKSYHEEISGLIHKHGWLFTPGKNKKKANELFAQYKRFVGEEFEAAVAAAEESCREKEKSSLSDAWKHFSENTVSYIKIIETLEPGIYGEQDTKYGLPGEIADELDKVDFSTDGLLCELRKYQETGVRYILRQGRVLLGDEMGLGKTVQAIAAMVSLKNSGATHFIVVCPVSVLSNWCKEISRHSTLPVTTFTVMIVKRNSKHGTGTAAQPLQPTKL